ncbi:hypothetical protein K2173_019000 [Erythroxylum novogranatense]|uniref:Pentatricopeptide repeat-containing protein n=1 Tax=Erythroxylum novogranatense TaxID=1862640 RepID=A0AAV8SSD4_9ROSI|nr:hypothetical protein K2173_019000 [Erythroxylum novogranatense]
MQNCPSYNAMERRTVPYIANLLQSCIDKKSHLSGKLIHASLLRIGLLTDTFLSNRLVEFYSKCNNTAYAHNVFDQIPQKNIYSWNAMLSQYCRVGMLERARRLFVEMPERNTVSWNNLITALVKGGFDRDSLCVFDDMVLQGFVPTRFTLASVFSACGTLGDVESASRCHGFAVKLGLDYNVYVSNALLCVYAKCGFVVEAERLFEGIEEPNEVTYTAMMSGLAQTDRVEDALRMFRSMSRKGIRIDSVSLSSILGVCAKGGIEESSFYDQDVSFLCKVYGQQVHGVAIRYGLESDLHLSNSLLDMYSKNGGMDSAEMIFAYLPEVSVVSWNIMIAGYGRYHCEKAVEYLQRMQSCRFEPDEVTCINVLAACTKCGDMETGLRVFDSMACPSVNSWNTLLSGYVQTGNHNEAIKLFRAMQFQNVQPDRTTLAVILSACAGMGLLESGKQMHAVSQKAALHNDLYVGSGLIGMYSKCGKIDVAQLIFTRMPELDTVCWNSMIVGFSLNSLNEEAFTFYKQMRQNGISATQFSYATILNCCTKLSSLFQGRQIQAHIEKEGYTNDIFVGTAIVDMYCKCGDVDEARQFFDMMPCRSTATWNEMIHGYAQNGQGNEAVHLYESMIKSGGKPEEITFIAVLTACSHSGLVDRGVEIFNSIQRDHDVDLIAEHYTCMIDGLSRAGRFHEAELLIDEMPYKDDSIVWEVLLSSCRVHANLGLAKRAAKELLRLDPQSSAPYLLLANMYSSLGRWDDAVAVRGLMTGKQVIKDPGYCWIEHKAEMQSFWADDNSTFVKDELSVANET